ncbi:MAG: hypothetical protein AAF391_14015, partial [Bacteroidota bacterium]
SFVGMSYSERVLLFNRLQKTIDALSIRNEQKRKELHSFQMLLSILKNESDVHGLSTRLAESLGTPPHNRIPDYWTWLTDHTSERSWTYSLEVSDNYRNSFSALDLPKYASFFPSQSSWGTFLMHAENLGNNLQEEIIGRYHRLELLNFRSDILERVLWDFEAFGHARGFNEVHQTQENETHVPEKNDEQPFAFLIAEQGLILYDQDPTAYNNRDSLLNKLLHQFGYSDTPGIVQLLKRYKLYNPQKVGRPTLLDEKKYLDQLIEIWRRARHN